MASIQELKKRLDRVGQIDEPLERRIQALAIVTESLSGTGITPILVGGMAVSLYTLGGYATEDIDVAMVSSPVVDQVLGDLGFARVNRFWVRDDIDIILEAPASTLHGDPGHVMEVAVGDLRAFVIGVEDLIIDRLNAYVHWDSREDGRWARRLIDIHGETLDWDYLRRMAQQENVAEALAEIECSWRRELGNEKD